MIKQSNGWLAVLSGLSLFAATFYFWHTTSDLPEVQKTAVPNNNMNVERSAGQEPITPIPLVMDLDKRKVALGQRLFHDPQLSHDNTIACASCHRLDKGGADGLPVPIGIGGKRGNINTLTVFNSRFNFRLFWDGRAA